MTTRIHQRTVLSPQALSKSAPRPATASRIHLVRHAESLSNAGHPTTDPASILLTERGRQQAEALALSIAEPPDLIVVSPYVRTRLTAEPLCRRFPQVPVEEWPVHEFTYLAPARYAGTTEAERAVPAHAYWEKTNPWHQDGEGAETFASMVSRVDALRQRLAALPPEQTALVFSHGIFMRAFLWRLEHPEREVDRHFMRGFRTFGREVGNTHMVPVMR